MKTPGSYEKNRSAMETITTECLISLHVSSLQVMMSLWGSYYPPSQMINIVSIK